LLLNPKNYSRLDPVSSRLVRDQGLTINAVFDVISVFGDFCGVEIVALSASFRHDISAASERIRLTSSNDVSWAFTLINDSLHIVTVITRLIVIRCFPSLFKSVD